MSAPVLSISEQKEAISGKKKKKKTMKNVLGIPSNLKVESQSVELHETDKLNKILERLLPSARLPVQPNTKSNKDSDKEVASDTELVTEIKKKRNQLSLGVNALSRNIKKELISAVLLAADIQPKFLVHHLNLLCNHNKIPFLHLPGLRNITKNNLGFPCIAVGFKKNYSDFSEAVEEIRNISESKKFVTDDTKQESPVESSSEESEGEICNENVVQSNEIPFTYLLRSSNKERVFVPEKCKNNETKPKEDIITLGKDDGEIKFDNKQLGISSNLIRKRKSVKTEIKASQMKIEDDEDDDDDDEYEDLEVPKKKTKKDWVIDKVGNRTYYPANLIRVPSNPNRNRAK